MRTWLSLALLAGSGAYALCALQVSSARTWLSMTGSAACENTHGKDCSPRDRDYAKMPPRRCGAVDAANNQCSRDAVEPTDYCQKHAQQPRRVPPKPKRQSSGSVGSTDLITPPRMKGSEIGVLWT
jgi:hypothetical protein